MKDVKISIICAVRNNARGLLETFDSIASQTFENYEVVVIDGNSEDNTVEILRKGFNRLSYWISEPDKNLYDAMNKGVKQSKGEWLVFMNGGDIFYDKNTLKNIDKELTDDYDLVFGKNIPTGNDSNRRIRKHNGTSHLWKGMQFSHQSMFVRRELCIEYPYNTNYKLMADYDFVLHCYFNKKRFKKVDTILSITEPGGLSDRKRLELFHEQRTIYRSYERNFFKELLLSARIEKEKVMQLLKKFRFPQ